MSTLRTALVALAVAALIGRAAEIPAVSVSPADAVATEGEGDLVFTIRLAKSADAAVQVVLAGAAITTGDVAFVSTSLTFSATGPAELPVRIAVPRDGAAEGPERGTLRVTDSANKTLALSRFAIRDADSLLVMAANITSGNRQRYEEPGRRLFRALLPDVVALQEFTPANGTHRAFVDAAFGPGFSFHVESEPTDAIPNGIVSRWPIVASGEWSDSMVPNRDFAWASIALPGPRKLHVVSVHLYASGSPGQRAQQARAIVEQARRQFPPDDYLVIAGDMNAKSREEPLLPAFGALVTDRHRPADAQGDEDTNVVRSKPLDFVLPDPRLDALHVPLGVEGATFPNGLVFDSRQWPDPPWPAYVGDAAETGMQHLPVLKLFRLVPAR
jgi:endonuclease/exonuclease/phosphatase family metal-dependent hydrolase